MTMPTIATILAVLRENQLNQLSLRVASMLLRRCEDWNQQTSQSNHFDEFREVLLPCLASPHSIIRQLALQVLQCFGEFLELCKEGSLEGQGKLDIFDVLVKAEETPTDFHHYREKAILFRRLKFGSLQRFFPNGRIHHQLDAVVVAIVLAQYYERLTIFWPLMVETIESFAYAPNVDFWKEMLLAINQATARVRSGREETSSPSEPLKTDSPFVNDIAKLARSQLVEQDEAKITRSNTVRIQLFKLMLRFPQLAEKRTKLLSPIAIELYNTEVRGPRVSNTEHSSQECDEADGSRENGGNNNVEEQSSHDDGADEQTRSEKSSGLRVGAKKRNTTRQGTKNAIAALKPLLSLFSKFHDGKGVHRQKELYAIYLELLLHHDEELRKVALDCICTCKEKFLLPYRERLHNLVSEKKLRDELVLFTVDEQNSVVEEQHRPGLMPIVMRILYGSFYAHTGVRAKAKRAAIFRFVGGCKNEELGVFFRLIFERVIEQLEFDENGHLLLNKSLEHISAELTPKLPLQKYKSVLGNLRDAIKSFAATLSQEQVELCFGALLVCGVHIHLAMADTEGKGEIRLLRLIRIRFFDTLQQLFGSFKRKAFSAEQVRALFESILLPMVGYHNNQCGEAPTEPTSWVLPLSVARLVIQWTEIPRYYGLLEARLCDGVSPLSLLCNTLSHPGTPSAIQTRILRAILHLLASTDEELEIDTQGSSHALELLPQLQAPSAESSKDTPLGTRALLPSIGVLLDYLSQKIANSRARKTPVIYFEILNRVSDFVENKEVGKRFVSTFASYLNEKWMPRDAEKLVHVIETITRLSAHIEEPLSYVGRVASLFSTLDERGPRDALVGLLRTLRQDSRMPVRAAHLLEVFEGLEAWDKNRISEPDVPTRLSSLERVQEECQCSSDIPQEVLELLVHSHFHCLSQQAELSLRTAASTTLRGLIQHLIHSIAFGVGNEGRLAFVHSCVVPLLLKGMTSENESCRYECVQGLLAVVAAFPEDQQFAALKTINRSYMGERGSEGDFFNSLVHLQIHRRQQAVSKLSERLAKTHEAAIPAGVLYHYVLPLIRLYFTAEDNSKVATLGTESLKLFSLILAKLTWKRYLHVLEHQLGSLSKQENTKSTVRILVAILDAFHFEFSGGSQEARKENPQEARAMPPNLLLRLIECTHANRHAHKKAQSTDWENDEESLARAPLVLSIVKLLLKMPACAIGQHLLGLLSSLERLLLSRNISTRKGARKIFYQVAKSLGPAHLASLMRGLKQTMTKGYQVPVMIYTVHGLVTSLGEQLHTGELDSSLPIILELCKMEMTGELADEKQESQQEATKVPEAKVSKLSETFCMLGEFATSKGIDQTLRAFEEIIDSKPSTLTMTKLATLLRSLATGLKKNKGYTPLELVCYSHGVLEQSLSTVLEQQRLRTAEEQKKRRLRPPSCLLLEPEPKRLGAVVKSSTKRSRGSIFMELALQLLFDAVKTRRAQRGAEEKNDDAELGVQLRSFVPLITECLRLKYDKIVALSLRCLSLLLKYRLEDMNAETPSLVDRLFVILSEHAGQGSVTNKMTGVELSTVLFKCFTLILRIAPITSLSPKRVQLLLNYAEADVLDSHRQATAFSLIRVMLERKIEDEKIGDLMNYFAELAITSSDTNVRVRCRQTLLAYATTHPSGMKTKDSQLEFFLEQLEYVLEDGRLSALEMIHSLVEYSSKEDTRKTALLIFVKVSPLLVNDESAKCRILAALLLKSLLASVDQSTLNDLYLCAKDWLQSDKVIVQLLAICVLKEFLQSEAAIGPKLNCQLMTLIVKPLCKENCSELWGEKLLQASYEFLSIATTRQPALVEKILSQQQASALKHFTDTLLTSMGCEDGAELQLAATTALARLVDCGDKVLGLFGGSTCVKTFCESLSSLIGAKSTDARCMDEAGMLLSRLMPSLNHEDYGELCHSLARLCWREIVRNPNEATKRLVVLRLMTHSAGNCSSGEAFSALCAKFVPLLHRELNKKSQKHTEELYASALELGAVLRERLGEKEYAAQLSQCQKTALSKHERRQREAKALAVMDPAAAVTRKQMHHERKKLAKKRKLDLLKPYRVMKRRRREAYDEKHGMMGNTA